MKLIYKGNIVNDFNGFDYNEIFKLSNGMVFKQNVIKYRYMYRYMPKVKLWKNGSKYYLEIDNINEMIEVERIN